MTLALALRDVRDAEARLADQLAQLGERHRAEHDVFHMCATLRSLHDANLRALEPFAERYPSQASARVAPPATGTLLGDLRHLHLLYAEASVDWVLLGQGAQALRDAELLAAVGDGHPQTLRGLKWTLTRLKSAAPQVLAG